MLEELFQEIEKNDLSGFKSILFNLYEDENEYTIEACFDDESLVIGRENSFEICGTDIPWNEVEKRVGIVLKNHIKENKAIYKNLKDIAYGFVDGDLRYIKKPRKKKEEVHFTADSFKDFDRTRLKAWLTIYLKKEVASQYGFELFKTDFLGLSEEQLQFWRELLADNFDYEKYYNL